MASARKLIKKKLKNHVTENGCYTLVLVHDGKPLQKSMLSCPVHFYPECANNTNSFYKL